MAAVAAVGAIDALMGDAPTEAIPIRRSPSWHTLVNGSVRRFPYVIHLAHDATTANSSYLCGSLIDHTTVIGKIACLFLKHWLF